MTSITTPSKKELNPMTCALKMYPPYHCLSASATPICRSTFSSLNQIKITQMLVTYLSEKLIQPLKIPSHQVF